MQSGFLLSGLDVSHAALEATHLVAEARRLDWQNGHTPSPFLMELYAPKQSCSARSEKTGVPRVTVRESFHGLFSDCQTCDSCLFFLNFAAATFEEMGCHPPRPEVDSSPSSDGQNVTSDSETYSGQSSAATRDSPSCLVTGASLRNLGTGQTRATGAT